MGCGYEGDTINHKSQLIILNILKTIASPIVIDFLFNIAKVYVNKYIVYGESKVTIRTYLPPRISH